MDEWQLLRRQRTERGFPLAMIIAGLLLTIVSSVFYLSWSEMQEWPTVQGVVVESAIEEGKDSFKDVVLRYRYEVDGTSYEHDEIAWLTDQTAIKADKANELVDTYPEGEEVTVYFDPSDPQDAYLDIDASAWVMLVLAGGGFLIFLAGCAFGVFMMKQHARQRLEVQG